MNATIRLLLRELCEPFRLSIFRNKWRNHNTHNRTIPGNRFPLTSVSVGRETYGMLNVFNYNNNKSGKLRIGNFCSIARTAQFLLSGNHSTNTFLSFPVQQFYFHRIPNESKGDIVIDDDVWIGEHALILSGVHVGRGAVVAAGAVVTSDVPPYSIVGGIPAKVLKLRFCKEIIHKLICVDFDKLTPDYIKKHEALFTNPLDEKMISDINEFQ